MMFRFPFSFIQDKQYYNMNNMKRSIIKLVLTISVQSKHYTHKFQDKIFDTCQLIKKNYDAKNRAFGKDRLTPTKMPLEEFFYFSCRLRF